MATNGPFRGLRLGTELLATIADCGYRRPTPIQARVIPFVLDGHDVLGVAQTGTGKTAAFAWPLLQLLSDQPGAEENALRALVLAPTRELARQIFAMMEVYSQRLELRVGLVHGGMGAEKDKALEEGVPEVLVATPGRLRQLEEEGSIHFEQLQILVLDEFDRMLDMGFLPAVHRLWESLPEGVQKLFFSATLPTRIRVIAERLMKDPIELAVDVAATPAQNVEQKVYFVRYSQKSELLAHLIESKGYERVLVFTRRKSRAQSIAEALQEQGIAAEYTHGGLKQKRRQGALDRFVRGETRVLVASDLASRGLDVEAVTHVINFDLPHEAGTYIHRIGRTGRAGQRGVAISFCDERDFDQLRQIELLLGRPIPIVTQHAFSKGAVLPPPPIGAFGRRKRRRRRGAQGQKRRRRR
ncbi:MAG: DEAD/DEAH box helicase [Planctomycetota bacterium]|nr:MAG: DEAD/DEAH box helicase [Planctomycetota bacterium]